MGETGKKVLVDTFNDPYNQVQVNIYDVPIWGI